MTYQEQVDSVISKAQFGDLIEFSYPLGLVRFSHWGVYDKDGHVIHFSVPDENALAKNFRNFLQGVVPYFGDLLLGRTKIRRQHLSQVNVPSGARVSINNGQHKCSASNRSVMKGRLHALLDKDFYYDLVKLNCEHFATYVRYGKAICNQNPFITKDKEHTDATKTFEGHLPSKCTTM